MIKLSSLLEPEFIELKNSPNSRNFQKFEFRQWCFVLSYLLAVFSGTFFYFAIGDNNYHAAVFSPAFGCFVICIRFC